MISLLPLQSKSPSSVTRIMQVASQLGSLLPLLPYIPTASEGYPSERFCHSTHESDLSLHHGNLSMALQLSLSENQSLAIRAEILTTHLSPVHPPLKIKPLHSPLLFILLQECQLTGVPLIIPSSWNILSTTPLPPNTHPHNYMAGCLSSSGFCSDIISFSVSQLSPDNAVLHFNLASFHPRTPYHHFFLLSFLFFFFSVLSFNIPLSIKIFLTVFRKIPGTFSRSVYYKTIL